MSGNMKRMYDYSEVDIQDTDKVQLNRSGANKVSTFLKLKNFILGTDTYKTTSQKVIAAINELKDAVDLKALLSTTPQKTIANLTYYVNAATGNDSNDGLTNGTAFKTLAKTVGMIPQIVNHTITIVMAPGTYAEPLSLTGFTGKGLINISAGNTTTEAINYVISYISCVFNSCKITIKGISANSTTDYALYAYSNLWISISFFVSTVSAAGTDGLFAKEGGNVYLGSSIISNRRYAEHAIYGANIISDSNTGSGNSYGLVSEYGASISKAGVQPTGVTPEAANYGGVIR